MAAGLVSWKEKAERLARASKNLREKSAQVGERAVGAGAAVASGYGVGRAMKKWGDPVIPGTDIPYIPAIAGVTAVAGILGMAGRMSDVAAAAGSGGLAGYAAILGSK